MGTNTEKYILTLDQGTTNSRALIFNYEGNIISTAQRKARQLYPRPGYVEHDPQELWSTQLDVAKKALPNAGLTASDIACIGVSNHRETPILRDGY